MNALLLDRRSRGGLHFAVAGARAEELAAQLGLLLAALPDGDEALPRPGGRAQLGPGLAPSAGGARAFAAGYALASSSPRAARAFAASWAARAIERGLTPLRVLDGVRGEESFAVLIVRAGESDPEALRAALREAEPEAKGYAQALDALAREEAYAARTPLGRVLALGYPEDAPPRQAPEVSSRAYAISAD